MMQTEISQFLLHFVQIGFIIKRVRILETFSYNQKGNSNGTIPLRHGCGVITSPHFTFYASVSVSGHRLEMFSQQWPSAIFVQQISILSNHISRPTLGVLDLIISKSLWLTLSINFIPAMVRMPIKPYPLWIFFFQKRVFWPLDLDFVETSPRSLGFSTFFSDFLVIFGLSLALNELKCSRKSNIFYFAYVSSIWWVIQTLAHYFPIIPRLQIERRLFPVVPLVGISSY